MHIIDFEPPTIWYNDKLVWQQLDRDGILKRLVGLDARRVYDGNKTGLGGIQDQIPALVTTDAVC